MPGTFRNTRLAVEIGRVRAGAPVALKGVNRRQLPAERVNPNTSRFSLIRAGVTDLGMTTLPCCRCQRSTTWAGVRPCRGRDVNDGRIVQHRALRERAPRLGGDAVGTVERLRRRAAAGQGGVQPG